MSVPANIQGLFKKYYADVSDLVPDNLVLYKKLPLDKSQKIGEGLTFAVVLAAESGVSFGGSEMEAITYEPAVQNVIKQATVKDYQSFLSSKIPHQMIARGAEKGDAAFLSVTKHVVKQNLMTHSRMLEIAMMYGQSADKLGAVSYDTLTHRGVSLTTGTGTVSYNGTSVALTNGVNTSSKIILIKHGAFASGIWAALEGVQVEQIATSSGLVVGSGSVVSVDLDLGAIEVDFTPTAASAADSHVLAFRGWAQSMEMTGMNKILLNTGSLFGISASQYNQWKANRKALGNVKLTFARVMSGLAQAVNKGGLSGKVLGIVNPRSFQTLLDEQHTAARRYDSSYSPKELEVGSMGIKFFYQAGEVEIVPSHICKEGEAYFLQLDAWSRAGSAELSFRVPGASDELIYPSESQSAWLFRSFASQAVFCHKPNTQLIITGIDDESST